MIRIVRKLVTTRGTTATDVPALSEGRRRRQIVGHLDFEDQQSDGNGVHTIAERFEPGRFAEAGGHWVARVFAKTKRSARVPIGRHDGSAVRTEPGS